MKRRLIVFLIAVFLMCSMQVQAADNVFVNQSNTPFKADVVNGVAIQGVKLVVGDNDTDGGYVSSTGSTINVTARNYYDQIVEGNIPGHDAISILGHNLSVGLTNEEVSALGAIGFGNWPATAAGVVLVSTDAADATAGTGARTVIITGLDDNYEEVTTTETMTGATPTTASTQIFLRINAIDIVAVGSTLSNVGTITASIGGTDIVAINPVHSVTDSGRYTVAAGKTAYLIEPWGSSVNGKDTTFLMYTRDAATANSPFLLKAIWSAKDNGFVPGNSFPIKVTEKHDIIFIARCEVDGGIVSVGIKGWIE